MFALKHPRALVDQCSEESAIHGGIKNSNVEYSYERESLRPFFGSLRMRYAMQKK